MLSLVFASLLLTQQSGQGVIAVNPDDPLTWVLEYPYAIQPYVDDYYNCLRGQEVQIGEGRTFEAQHRLAIPACNKVEKRSVDSATESLARRGDADRMTASDVTELFRKIQLVHVARGKDLDDQIAMGLGGDPYAQQVGETAEQSAVPETTAIPVIQPLANGSTAG